MHVGISLPNLDILTKINFHVFDMSNKHGRNDFTPIMGRI
jgi:hypothetical protein